MDARANTRHNPRARPAAATSDETGDEATCELEGRYHFRIPLYHTTPKLIKISPNTGLIPVKFEHWGAGEGLLARRGHQARRRRGAGRAVSQHPVRGSQHRRTRVTERTTGAAQLARGRRLRRAPNAALAELLRWAEEEVKQGDRRVKKHACFILSETETSQRDLAKVRGLLHERGYATVATHGALGK